MLGCAACVCGRTGTSRCAGNQGILTSPGCIGEFSNSKASAAVITNPLFANLQIGKSGWRCVRKSRNRD